MKKIVIATVFLIVIGILFLQRNKTTQIINSFDECVAAGYGVLESYPPQCITPDGKSFKQNIGNEFEMKELIQIDTPRPNQKIDSTLQITGRARGPWYFEANFSVELVDKNNKIIGSSIAQAEGEWMTEEFVPFISTLTFQKPETKTGTLILKNANPSGLPENDKTLRIPVQF